jgi:hypothetical protein
VNSSAKVSLQLLEIELKLCCISGLFKISDPSFGSNQNDLEGMEFPSVA